MVFLRRPAAEPEMPRASESQATEGSAGRAPPEPLTLVLPAVAVLGAVASIAAVAFLAEDRDGARPRVRRRIEAILKDLETCCLGTAEILRRVRRHARQLGLDGPTGTVPMKLGLSGGRVGTAAGQLYHQLINDLATMMVLATQNAYDAVNAIEDGELEAPEAIFYGFGEAQERLNALLVQRAGFRQMVDGCVEVADRLAELVRELKQYA